MIEVITVGNGTNDYPGNFTKKEIRIINENILGKTLHLFSGKSDIGEVRIDYKHGNFRVDVFYYLKCVSKNAFQTILIDAPYNQRFADIYQKLGNTPKQFVIFANAKKTTELFELVNNLDPDLIILKSWNYYVPKGYNLKKCYLCYPGGYRKSTILEILEKI